MPYKNKEERAAYQKEYRANNKIKKAEYQKDYCARNKEAKAIYYRKWYTKNKERELARSKENNKTPTGIKSRIISSWKYNGVKGDLSKFYDERYLPASSCEVCEKVFKSTNDKCMDHSHTTGEIRHVLCRRCNTYDNWIKVLANKNK